MPDATATVLIAHGSRNPAAAADHAELTDRIARAAGTLVLPAYLELSEPSVSQAVDRAVDDGATTVRLVPLFLHVGNHVLRDLPALAEAARRRHPGVTVVLDEHIGADPALVELVAGRIRGAD
jgi:sirohydrochlorin ferrochelatase